MSSDNFFESSNKRIAKNTLFLYMRMIVMIVISLYTSRIILQALGVEDFGLYSVIGGVVVLFSFINNAMTNASQRFLSFAIGKKDLSLLQKTFCMSLNSHFIIAVIVLVLSETVGLWFVKEKLIVPDGREQAVFWCYQLTIAVFLFSVVRVPFNALVVSCEKMSFYAYISIFDAAAKLGVALAIMYTNYDKLICYSFLLLLVTVASFGILWLYCRTKFSQYAKYIRIWDTQMFKEMTIFSGWSMFNGCANVTSHQGGNILVNLFNGVVANASYGISSQVSNIINGFVGNFQVAFQPQIVKLYASGSNRELHQLICRTSSFSFYLLLIIVFPLVVEMDFVLRLWLSEVPGYAVDFCRLSLMFYLIDAIQAPLWMLVYGTGEVKKYTLTTGLITFLNIPVAYVLLKLGLSVNMIFIIRIFINITNSIYRCYYVKKEIGFPINKYVRDVVGRALIVLVSSVTILLMYLFVLKDNYEYHIINICVCIISVGLLSWFVGINSSEKIIIKRYVVNKLKYV